jgi:Membrane proteins related to metalloendopeptidases
MKKSLSKRIGKDMSISKRKKRVLLGLLGIAACVFVGLFSYALFSEYEEERDVEVVSELSEEEMQAQAPVAPEETVVEPAEEDGVFSGVIASGDTAGNILLEWMDATEVHNFIEACKEVYGLHKIHVGQPFTVKKDNSGLVSFEYEIDSHTKLVVNRETGTFIACVVPIEYEITLARATNSISSNLFSSMSAIEERASLAVRLAEIFAWEINFIRDIKEGDSFSVLVEKRFRDGEFKGYGRILAAEFINNGKVFESYVFKDSFGKDQYYNDGGESLKRAFLKAPLSFTRISSGFSNSRLHPILNIRRAHPAIDYAAPTGTPVKAVGDGVVTFAGSGTGAGNYIQLKHNGGYETMYLHLSRFAKGLKKGMRVSQGQVIGFVGSTGYATGPHLDFRMKKNGQWVNPTTALSPRAEPLNAAKKIQFMAERDVYREFISGKKDLAEYVRPPGLQEVSARSE